VETYDPDELVQLPDFNLTYRFEVPPKRQFWSSFASDAAWENCICLTRLQPVLVGSLQRSNYPNTVPNHPTWLPRSLNPFTYYNYGTKPDIWVVSGWHKHGGPSGSLPWIQSPIQVNSVEPLTYVRFEDASDEDWNDIWMEIKIG
jgi:hypothetical protein